MSDLRPSPLLLLADLIDKRERHPLYGWLVKDATKKATRGSKNAAAFLSLLGLKLKKPSRPARRRSGGTRTP